MKNHGIVTKLTSVILSLLMIFYTAPLSSWLPDLWRRPYSNMDENVLNGFDPGRLVTFADIREAMQAANGITTREITEQASVRMNIEDNRYRELCNRFPGLKPAFSPRYICFNTD